MTRLALAAQRGHLRVLTVATAGRGGQPAVAATTTSSTVLIAERAPQLSATRRGRLVRPLLYALLDYGKARRMADAIAPLPGRAALDHISDLLALKVAPRRPGARPGARAA